MLRLYGRKIYSLRYCPKHPKVDHAAVVSPPIIERTSPVM